MCIILIDSRNKIKIVVQKSGYSDTYIFFSKFNVAESHDQNLITHLSRINRFVFIYSLINLFFKEINKK